MSSSFAEILKTMVERVPGALAAVFADWEGEAVDLFGTPPTIEIQLAGAHWGVVFMLANDHLRDIGAGAVEELWIETDRGLTLIRRVTDRYYVVLAAKQTAHLQTARRELERSAASLLGEM
jgi:predicted regulator of Ras-like GTPase activity (Roadblock/LC7/MglB family)